MKKIIIVLMIFLTVFRSGIAQCPYKVINIESYFNGIWDQNSGTMNIPSGPDTLAGVPFLFACSTCNNYYASEYVNVPFPVTLAIPVNQTIDSVFALINTHWGQTGGPYASVAFMGGGKILYQKYLYGNVDIRDFNLFYTNQINGTSTINAYTDPVTNRVLDMVQIALPPSVQSTKIDSILFIDNGGNGFQTLAITGLTLKNGPAAKITAESPATFCAGDSVTLTAKAGAGYKFKWSTGATTSSITVGTTGNFEYTVTNKVGCSAASAVKKVTVNPLPIAKITASANQICTGGTATLTAGSGTGYKYDWSTGATTRAVTVNTTGNYDLSVSNTHGCTAMAGINLTCTTGPVDGKTDNSSTISSTAAVATNFDISVYPNPYSAQFHLKVTGGNNSNITVRIYDINGKMREERKDVVYANDIMLGSGYAAGVYLVQAQQGAVTKELKVVKTE